jgi:hypothetical protein
MPPDMDYLDKLRLTRCYIQSQIDMAESDFDSSCLSVMLDLVERTISHIEFIRRF